MSDTRIHRVTLFKVKDEDKQLVITAYEELKRNAIKDGKSYILSMILGEAFPDQRSQGYTVVAKLEFASKEDCDYYDTDCPGHKVLKASAGHLAQALLTVNFHPVSL